MRACGVNPAEIDAVVLSYGHYDHAGGLGAFLEANSHVTVYPPRVFPEGFKREVRKAGATVVETDELRKVCKGAWTTGVLGGGIPEQGLYLNGNATIGRLGQRLLHLKSRVGETGLGQARLSRGLHIVFFKGWPHPAVPVPSRIRPGTLCRCGRPRLP